MEKEPKYNVRQIEENDFTQLVELYNRNNEYQFPSLGRLTVADFSLTLAAKETSHFYVLEKNNKIIGTTAFYKFTVFGSLSVHNSYSGFLLIDNMHRTGSAISYLHKEILKDVAIFDFHTYLTEISKYNKASLSLSKRNGFTHYSDSYEDMFHCCSFRSMLPKILTAFRFTGNLKHKYTLNTFKLLSEMENIDYSTILTEISGEKMKYGMISNAPFPYFIQMNDFIIELLYQKGSYFLSCTFLSDNVKNVKARYGNFQHVHLTRKKPKKRLYTLPWINALTVQGSIDLKEGEINVQLSHAHKPRTYGWKYLQIQFLSYNLAVNLANGSLYLLKENIVVLEDTFIMASSLTNISYKVKEYKDKIIITASSKDVMVKKEIYMERNKFHIKILISKVMVESQSITGKIGLRIGSQDYLIHDGDEYLPYIPGQYPIESDDFLKQKLFNDEVHSYILVKEQMKIMYCSSVSTSNQMQFRPLSLFKFEDYIKKPIYYDVTFEPFIINYPLPLADLHQQKFSWSEIKDIKVFAEETMGVVRKVFKEDAFMMGSFEMDFEKNTITVDTYPIKNSKYVKIEFSYFSLGPVFGWKAGDFYQYNNKGPFWEMEKELLLFDKKRGRYVFVQVEQGRIYSYKENHVIKIQCITPRENTKKSFIQLTQFTNNI